MAEQLVDKGLVRRMSLVFKELRKKADITQDIFFYDTNIHIARLEQGTVNPSVTTVKRVCKYFEISLVEFFQRVEEI